VVTGSVSSGQKVAFDRDVTGAEGIGGNLGGQLEQEQRPVLDTGAAATTLTPRVIEKIGYTGRDGFKKAKVHTRCGRAACTERS
jgi:hypothetical protein